MNSLLAQTQCNHRKVIYPSGTSDVKVIWHQPDRELWMWFENGFWFKFYEESITSIDESSLNLLTDPEKVEQKKRVIKNEAVDPEEVQ